MAVYHMAVSGLTGYTITFGTNKGLNPAACFKKVLENTKHSFVFIPTIYQWDNWMSLIEKYEMEKFVSFEMPYFVSNRRYPTGGRKLRLMILTGKGKDENQT